MAVVLLISYGFGLFFSLRSHKHLFNPYEEGDEEEDHGPGWSLKKAIILLAVAGVLVGITSEVLVGSLEETAEMVGISQRFIGVFVVAIVGNAAEHWVAVLVAAKNKMDLAMNIAIGSSAQIALFVAPVLVLLSFVFGPDPLALVFNGYEIAAMLFAVLIANFTTQEGETNWFEGVQLLALVAVKLLIEDFVKIGPVASFAIVVVAFAVGIIASLLADRRDEARGDEAEPPEEDSLGVVEDEAEHRVQR